MNPLIEFWPTPQHIEECLRTEAETVDQALLLAVHLPVTLKRRSAQGGLEENATENDLLNALLRPINDGSSVVVAVTGLSGVGKSHMIRWLGAQIDRLPQRDNVVVVSIPKTASLRRVVELILEPLRGEQYRAMKQDLGRAVESLDPPRAAEHLATALAEELEPYAAQIEADLRSNRDPDENRRLGPRVIAARRLRDLLRDPDVRDNWFREVLLRIVRASIGGTADPANRQFHAADFEAPEVIAGKDLRQVVHQALAFLASANGIHRTTAAHVLQEVLDPALRATFRFTDALHQKTIQEVVDDIRKQLLVDGKELLLLIEDLAALSGIQQPLLDIMIAESDEKGVRVRAPIRTAVAVTDGFLAGRQTVFTRAREEWVVPSEGMDEETVANLLVEFTGRYLNAARWGIAQLKREFSAAKHDLDDLYSWVPKFEPTLDVKSSEQLEAFGRSDSGYSLFPFNALAIRSLAATVLKVGDAWTFNPRAYINEVLSKTLSQRLAFEEGRFPPANFRNPRLLAEVSVSLQHHGLSPEQRGRMESALFHWAGNPRSLTAATQISPEVFDVFSLFWPFDALAPSPSQPAGGKRASVASATVAGIGNATVSPNPSKMQDTQAITQPVVEALQPASQYAEALESWTIDTRLTKTFPLRTRTLLAEALNQRMDFDDWCLHGHNVQREWFWLPPASTTNNPSTGLKIEVSPPDEPISPHLIAGLKALDRWDINERSWSYPNAESDYAAANFLLEGLERKVLDLMLSEAVRDTNIATLALHRQDVLLGITTRPENPHLKDLLAAAPKEPTVAEDSVDAIARRALTGRFRATEARAELQDRLIKYLACYQGSTGRTVMAIDAERYRIALKQNIPVTWSFALKSRGGEVSDALLDALERLGPQSIDILLRDLAAAVDQFLPGAAEAFAEDHARVAWRDEMRRIAEEASRSPVWPTGIMTLAEVRGAIDRLSVDTIETTIQRLRKMQPADETPEVHRRLAALSAVPLPQLIAVHRDVAQLRRFLTELNKQINAQTSSIDDQTAIREHDKLVNALAWEE